MSEPAPPARIGPCPQCRKSSVLDAGNPWRPFCSERCKLLDLGSWMSGRYAIPVEDPGTGRPGLPDDPEDQ